MRANDSYDAIGNRRGKVLTLDALAMVTHETGDVSSAIHQLERALALAREYGYHQNEAEILGHLSLAFAP